MLGFSMIIVIIGFMASGAWLVDFATTKKRKFLMYSIGSGLFALYNLIAVVGMTA